MKELYGKLKDVKKQREQIVQRTQENESHGAEKMVKKKNVYVNVKNVFREIYMKLFGQLCDKSVALNCIFE